MTDEPPFIDRELGHVINGLRLMPLDDLTEGLIVELAARLDVLLQTKAVITEFLDALQLALIDAMPEDEIEIPQVGLLIRSEKRRSAKFRDDSSRASMRHDIAIAIARRIGTDEFTGEVDPKARTAAMAAIREVWTLTPSFNTMLKAGATEHRLTQADYTTQGETYNTLTLLPEGDPKP